VWVLDIDLDKHGPQSLQELERIHSGLPATLQSVTGGGGRHLFWRWPDSLPDGWRIPNAVGGKGRLPPGLDTRADGGYVVLPPSYHKSGNLYAWPAPDAEIADAPAWLIELVAKPVPVPEPATTRAPSPVVIADREGRRRAAYGAKVLDNSCAKIAGAGPGVRHDTILSAARTVGGFVASGCILRDAAILALTTAADAAYGKPDRAARRAVASAVAHGEREPLEPPEADARPQNPGSDRPSAPRSVSGPMPSEEVPPPDDDDAPPAPGVSGHPPTELGNARRLVHLHGTDWRWAERMVGNGWLRWDASRWVPDETRAIRRHYEDIIPDIRADADAMYDAVRRSMTPGAVSLTQEQASAKKEADRMLAWSGASQAASCMRNSIDLAAHQPGVHCRIADLDADAWLLNCRNGTVHLDAAKPDFRPAARADLITRRCGCDYIPDATAPEWAAFLHTIFDGDADLSAFVQRAVGYSLAGVTSEQLFIILHGTGSNGKSTFIETIGALLGDYSKNVRPETFAGGKDNSIPNDIAALAGTRFLTTAETREGSRLDESLIKQATGGDRLSARFLHKEWFDFTPQFTLWMSTNHRPTIKGTDHGIWRRVRLVPFTVCIPDDKQDHKLKDKLRAELPGILNWCLDGCLAWQEHGLKSPTAVLQATSDYRSEMDLIADFLADCCIVGDTVGGVRNDLLYRAFAEWSESHGEFQRSHRWFSAAMKQRVFAQDPSRKYGREWAGVKISSTVAVQSRRDTGNARGLDD
jgi:putative DNA primase/helicase